jgi:asparagine synthase (glutamine-hydrolysing)
MCGICGKLNLKQQGPVFLEEIRRMAQSIAHRGPDDEGFYISGSIGLGFRRLSIIDLEGGHQPMSDSQETVWVVFNGEIYNHKELRQELGALGHRFRTNSDTEVLVHGYKEWGEGMLPRLNGMFAFAIWDEPRRKLVLARDRAGIKPVYYAIEDDTLLFGSEIRPIAAARKQRLIPNPGAIALFLQFRHVPSPLTIYDGIRKLAAGTKLVVQDGNVKIERWWNSAPQNLGAPGDPKDTTRQLLELYKQAVKRQLMSDVPVGLLLSGGLDSGLLLGMMNLYGSNWKTFTVGFGESYKDDELSDAEMTARALSAPNYGVEISRAAFEETLPKIVSILEDPIASPSAVLMYFLCERARQDVKVALIGQGPDELLGGYKRHLGLRYGSYWRAAPRWATTSVSSLIRRLPRNEMLKRGLSSLSVNDRIERYAVVFSVMAQEVVEALFRPEFFEARRAYGIKECWGDLRYMMDGADELGGFQFLEVRSSLPDELLLYADKVSMHHGLEVRVPYLDHDIIDFVERLPSSYKVNGLKRKWIHTQICKEFLPSPVLRRRKRGFGYTVVDDWYRESMNGKIGETLADHDSLVYQYLNPSAIKELVREHQEGIHDHHKVLFNLVVLEQWMRNLN